MRSSYTIFANSRGQRYSVSEMASRPLLDQNRVSSTALAAMQHFQVAAVRDVARATERHRVVVVGMSQNPFVRKARRALWRAQIDHEYLEYGSYLSQWRPRLAIKLWSGWPTFPQIFFEGQLIGGHAELVTALSEGRITAG